MLPLAAEVLQPPQQPTADWRWSPALQTLPPCETSVACITLSAQRIEFTENSQQTGHTKHIKHSRP